MLFSYKYNINNKTVFTIEFANEILFYTNSKIILKIIIPFMR